jgi:two-component system, LytTR family, response regulator
MKNINKILITIPTGYLFISLDEILYLQAEGRKTIFKMKDGHKYFVHQTLTSMHNRIKSSHFFRCNRKFVVNLHFVKFAYPGYTDFLLATGQKIPVSRNKGTEIKNIMKG